MNIEYVENRLRSLFFALELYSYIDLYSNLTELNNFWRISTYRNIFLHQSTAVVSHTLIQFGYLLNSFSDVTVVTVNKLTLLQMWSLVTSIGTGGKSCDFNV